MKRDDLTQISHIGKSRMQRFNNIGITTIQQLHEMPLEDLAKIETIGAFYALKIKDGVAAYYAKNSIKPPPTKATATENKSTKTSQQATVTKPPKRGKSKKASKKKGAAGKAKITPEEGLAIKKRVKKLQKQIKGINAMVQPILEKKYQELYTDFETNFKQLKSYRKTIDQTYDTLSKKAINKMAKKADAVGDILKNIKKKPNMAQYKAITLEIQSLAKALKKFCS